MTTLNDYRDLAHELSASKGFWEKPRNIGEALALVHSEISEALEEVRSGRGVDEVYSNADNPLKPEGFPVELADAIIRILDLCGGYDIDIDGIVKMKLAYNNTRPALHGRQF